MNRPIRWYDYITVNSYWFGLTFLSQTMTPIVVPLLVQSFVGEAVQGTYYGNLRLWSLMVAILVQSLMGMLSDHSRFRLGRRRPYILVGSIGLIFVLAAVGFSASLEGMQGYSVLMALIILQMIAANTAHGATQGLIPDLVPEEKRGRFSGVKAILEIPLPVILVSFTVAPLIGSGNLWAGLFVVMGVIALVAAITMFVSEKSPEKPVEPLDWAPFLRLVLMTVAFTIVILVMGAFVRALSGIAAGLTETMIIVIFGFAGLAAMLIAVAAGVWISVRIGLGSESRSHPGFSWWVISRLAFLVGVTNVASFIIYFLQGRVGYQAEEAARPASLLTMFVGVFILIAAVPSGWLSDRFGRKPVLVASGILGALGTLIVIISPSLTFLYAGGILFGIAAGLFYAANWALGTDIVPKEQAGRFLGISNLAGAGAGAIGAYIGGPIADLISNRVPIGGMGYTVLFAIYAVLFVVSILVLRRVHEKTQPSREDAVTLPTTG